MNCIHNVFLNFIVHKFAIFRSVLQYFIDRFIVIYPKIVDAQENFLYHLNLKIYHDHEKLTPGIKGILYNQLLHLIESDI